MKFNVNHKVRVKLTGKGRQILADDKFAIPPKEDADGWSEWQMWCLMEQFGRYIYIGCQVPFETEIEVPNGTEQAAEQG